MLRYARERGVKVMGETCPQYLFFTIEHLRRTGWRQMDLLAADAALHRINARMWEGLHDGTLQTRSAPDHCPFFYDGTKPFCK